MTSKVFLDKKIEDSKKENEIKYVNKKNKYKLIKNNLVFFVNINYGEKNKDYIKKKLLKFLIIIFIYMKVL